MEKQIITTNRYQVFDGYYVDVREEVAGTGEKDYWLCNKKRKIQLFMFTKKVCNQKQEEQILADRVRDYIQRYERMLGIA